MAIVMFCYCSFFRLTPPTGRAAGTVSCAAPSTIGLTTPRSSTTSVARREATPSSGSPSPPGDFPKNVQ